MMSSEDLRPTTNGRKPLGKLASRLEEVRNPWRQVSTLELSHNEAARLATDALLEHGEKEYRRVLSEERELNFLSPLEICYITQHAAKACRPDSNGAGPNDRDFGDGDAVSELTSGTYFPLMSDEEPPMLELGWPDSPTRYGPSETQIYFQRDKSHNVKDLIRSLINKAKKVIALVMDVFTDVDLLCDLMEASNKRKVPVYILLDEKTLSYFTEMCSVLDIQNSHLSNMRIRSVCGDTYCTKSGKKFTGQVLEKFMIIDCEEVIAGSYSFTWLSAQVHSNMVMHFSGRISDSFDREFRCLYADSQIIDCFYNPEEDGPYYSTYHATMVPDVVTRLDLFSDRQREKMGSEYSSSQSSNSLSSVKTAPGMISNMVFKVTQGHNKMEPNANSHLSPERRGGDRGGQTLTPQSHVTAAPQVHAGKGTNHSPVPEQPTQTYSQPIPEPPTQTYSQPIPERPTQTHSQHIPERPTQTHGQPIPERPTQTHSQHIPERPMQTHGQPIPERPTQTHSQHIPERPMQTHGQPIPERPTQTHGQPIPERPTQIHGQPISERLMQTHSQQISERLMQTHGQPIPEWPPLQSHSQPIPERPPSQTHGQPVPERPPSQTHGQRIPERPPSQTHGQPIPERPLQTYGQPTPERPLQTYGQPIPERPWQTYGQPIPERPPQNYGQTIPERPPQTHGQPIPERPPQTYGQPMGIEWSKPNLGDIIRSNVGSTSSKFQALGLYDHKASKFHSAAHVPSTPTPNLSPKTTTPSPSNDSKVIPRPRTSSNQFLAKLQDRFLPSSSKEKDVFNFRRPPSPHSSLAWGEPDLSPTEPESQQSSPPPPLSPTVLLSRHDQKRMTLGHSKLDLVNQYNKMKCKQVYSRFELKNSNVN